MDSQVPEWRSTVVTPRNLFLEEVVRESPTLPTGPSMDTRSWARNSEVVPAEPPAAIAGTSSRLQATLDFMALHFKED